jgi:hypothetical protein
MINNLKTASARRTRNRFPEHIAKFYSKPLFWHRAYFVGSVGGATLEPKNTLASPLQKQKSTASARPNSNLSLQQAVESHAYRTQCLSQKSNTR